MSNTNNAKATFGRKAVLTPKKSLTHNTRANIVQRDISIKVSIDSHVSKIKVSGHIKVDFKSKQKKDSYKELNKMLKEG
ncbi:MAG: hypothetical protein IJ262_02095 [Clostridia bacterium]|nr:hypothetical protein [Clostridia bacterium]